VLVALAFLYVRVFFYNYKLNNYTIDKRGVGYVEKNYF